MREMAQMQQTDRYLDLLEAAVGRLEPFDQPRPIQAKHWKLRLLSPVQALLARAGLQLHPYVDPVGLAGETMIGPDRLANVRACVETVLADQIPGDLIETGVWRGGTTILMRAVLAAHGVDDRVVWVADSFQGFPDDRVAIDRAVDYTGGHGNEMFAVGVDQVKANFARYGLLDDQVRFLVGWFADTLPTAPIEQLAVLRLDGDLYQSTWDAISILEPKVSDGGFVIVDDYGMFGTCRQAIDEYRHAHDITEPMMRIDYTGHYWRKGSAA
jgi:hypothetical protein